MVTHMEAADASVAVAIYGANLFVASGLVTALLYYVERNRHLLVGDSPTQGGARLPPTTGVYAVTALAVIVALVAPVVAAGIYIVVAVAFLIQPLFGAWRRPQHSSKQ